MEKIRVEDLTFSYDKERNAVEAVSFAIEEGSYTTIIGHNGSGKSTIAKLLIGLLDKDQGHIYVDGEELTMDTLYDIRDKVGIVFQNPDNQFIGATVADDIAFGLENHQVASEYMQEIIDRYAQKVGMSKYMQSEPTKLSGGQKQRTAVARALMNDPLLILADEPTGNLDSRSSEAVIEAFLAAQRNLDATIFMVTHDSFSASYCDRVIVMKDGKIYKELIRTGDRRTFLDELLTELKIINGGDDDEDEYFPETSQI